MWITDGLRNLVTALGNPLRDKSANWAYTYTPVTPEVCLAAYMSDWLAAKIVDIVAEDMVREWRVWQCEQADDLYETEKSFKLRSKIREAVVLDRLFGGSAILIGTGDANVERPLDVSKISKGGIKYLKVFSRHDLIAQDPIRRIEDEDYDLPEFYRINRSVGEQRLQDVRIHRSRFVFLVSSPIPSIAGIAPTVDGQRGWGQPLYDKILDAVVSAGATAKNGALMTEEANVDVVSIPNLNSQLADAKSKARFVERFSLMAMLKSTNRLTLLGGDEKYERKQITFAGFVDLLNANYQIASGAADIPIVRLLGQSPAGLNATGDSDIRNYYDNVKARQDDLTDSISRLDQAIIRHTLGDTSADGVIYDWNPLWQLKPSEVADIFQKFAAAITALNGTGLFAQEELRPAVADVLVEKGFLPTLDQHMLSDKEAEALLGAVDPTIDPATGLPIQAPPGTPAAPPPGGGKAPPVPPDRGKQKRLPASLGSAAKDALGNVTDLLARLGR